MATSGGVKAKGAKGSTTSKPGRAAAAKFRSAYDQFKEFEGKRYTGMKVGRRHKWRYEAGEWHEKKVTPDKWEFQYAVKKRRAGHAPEGSGAPVGTSYGWYILAHQIVTKLDANTYSTEMVGMKHKLAHKRADKETWSASDRAQRRALTKILQEMITELENQETQPVAPAAPAPAEAKAKPAAAAAPRSGTAARAHRARPRSPAAKAA
jgi:hypothetical protein